MQFKEWLDLKEGKKDACYHKVKAKMAVWPSAYGSGLLVQCRKKGAKNWGNSSKKKKKRKKNEDQFSSEQMKTESKILTFEMFCETKFKKEKEEGLHGWFSRKTGGWIDCKASKKGHLVPCGRKKAGKGAERAYPACRPTLSACTAKGKKRKKSSKRISWE